jgi:hypothetical protein
MIVLGKRCPFWPDCPCSVNLPRWQQNLEDEERVWSLEELRDVETFIYVMLTCAAVRCPDERIRVYAQTQLANPFWNRQRMGGQLSEEEFNQKRGLQ